MKSPTVLILTAGFGEGHNSAARSLSEAVRLESAGAVKAEVVDLFTEAAPVTGAFYKNCYKWMITYLPGLWHWLFEQTKRGDFGSLWWDRFVGVGAALERQLARHQPAALILTYPVYPYFLAQRTAALGAPVFMTITDSISIHPIWLQGVVDRLFVTDTFSQDIARAGLRQAIPVEVSGFPVSPAFGGFPDRPAEADPQALKVLYFATTATDHVRKTLRGLLEQLPDGACLTVVMGRHAARLDPVVRGLLETRPGFPVELVGWTNRVPELLMEHDVVISKAGGATVHECLAAGVPVLVNYIIPGQEEGNAELLERYGCGCRSLIPEETGALLAAMLEDGRLAAMRQAMALHRCPDGALKVARTVLSGMAS
jgi:processive 1,2-diacylglycerol beta-glucosyltransferase